MTKHLDYKFIKELKQLEFVEEIWLFGSRARGDNQERSDIDIAILCPKATNSDWLKVTDIIEEADTLLKIDCIKLDKAKISKDLYNNILKDKKVIYMKELEWRDYFYTLGKAIDRLKEVLEHPELDQLDFLRDATIQRFEFTIELFWKVMKKILWHEKIESTTPKDVLSKAYQYKLINEEEIWITMLDDRNNTSHAYKEEEAKLIFEHIKTYLPVFVSAFEDIRRKYNI
ncbi:MAG: HI0074 family nucleotidyltransferase substrate-binding subunit [Rickettsiaceae bacterium]|nr:HI0074 family nucleotidyltransferase substrate-binding subunit [Rickettsiaceae bacterium]